jgi:hypothetical protein
MSLSVVRPFFRSVLNSQGYTEWTDGFNSENIPSTILDKSYHIETFNFTGLRLNQLDQEIETDVTVSLFFKGYRDSSNAIDVSIQKVEDFIKEVLKPSSRVGQFANGIKNITLQGFSLEPKDATNDSLVKASVNFSVFVIIETN